MDKDEILGFIHLTDKDLACKDCVFRGEPYEMPVSKCLYFEKMKPMKVLAGNKCPAYEKDEDI